MSINEMMQPIPPDLRVKIVKKVETEFQISEKTARLKLNSDILDLTIREVQRIAAIFGASEQDLRTEGMLIFFTPKGFELSPNLPVMA